MSRVQVFPSPLFLGFEHLERLLDQASKAADNFPPYNIERFAVTSSALECWRITLAVAGFVRTDLEVTVADRQLTIRGARQEDETRDYMHRGIAGRTFIKSFVLADGMEVESALLTNGLLTLALIRRAPEKKTLRIDVKD
jgi:HSP20 family molecular chaperone IbpA